VPGIRIRNWGSLRRQSEACLSSLPALVRRRDKGEYFNGCGCCRDFSRTPVLPAWSPSRQGNHQMNINVEDIRARAYQLWQLAGEPEGKEDLFWLEAERELREKQIRHELRTPDNL